MDSSSSGIYFSWLASGLLTVVIYHVSRLTIVLHTAGNLDECVFNINAQARV